MILIITHKTDFTADYVINKLNDSKIEYRRLNCEDIFENDFSIKLNSDFSYQILDKQNYSSVWFRRTKLPEIEGLTLSEKIYILEETESLFKNLFSTISANWLSSPASVYRAENKIFQLKIAKELGFNIPKTLITNSKIELKKFYYECSEQIIIKPISQTRITDNNVQSFIFTNPISKEIIGNLEQFDLTPTIFQENIEKEYELRITVVGDKVFPAAVYSQEDIETKHDWRRKKLDFKTVKIPKKLESLCIELLKALDLKFGAIDLIKSVNNEYYFLEINPNGQWVWIETETGLKISEKIIKLLTT